jgi:hypothetical protein
MSDNPALVSRRWVTAKKLAACHTFRVYSGHVVITWRSCVAAEQTGEWRRPADNGPGINGQRSH